MRLTRRGWSVVGLIAFCLFMSYQYGSRSLNAVVVPLVIVLLAGVLTVYRADQPSVRRNQIEEGFIGETRSVTFQTSVETPVSARLEDTIPDGVSSTDTVLETTLKGDGTHQYEIRLESRGEHRVGPVTITVCDVLGLVTRTFESSRTAGVVVYPRVYDLWGGAKHDLQLLADAARQYQREEFDHLREYERGDDLRDIHWRSAAKRPDAELVVKEFVSDDSVGSATLVAENTPDRVDEMATALASVATYLLEMDVNVGVAVADGREEPESGEDHYRRVLRLLATARGGPVSETLRREADVLVQTDPEGTVVIVDGHEIPFERLCGRTVETGAESGPERGSDTDGDAPRSDEKPDAETGTTAPGVIS